MATKAEKKPAEKAATAPAKTEALLHSIGDLASEFGISTRAIRFYESKGLLAPERVGSNRIYTKRDRARLILVLRGKRLGFSLEEIAEYLDLYDSDPDQVAQTRLLLQKVETSIGDLTVKQKDIEEALQELRDIRAQCIAQLKS
ncbi:MAG: MerR family DNA-binding transcriptional regulator [Rhodomicrobium sp.]|nr:MerR family DNA-binding transcriptional regulator [Rhodomicrobium sp.]